MATRACVCHEPPCPQQTAQACSACQARQDLRTWLAQVHQGLVGLGQRLVKKNAARHRPPQHGGQAVKAAEGLAAHAARRAIASGCKAIAWGRGRGVQQNGHTFSIHVGACCRRPAAAASGAAMSQLLDPIPNALAGRCGGRAVCQSIRPSKPGQWLDQGRKERSSGRRADPSSLVLVPCTAKPSSGCVSNSARTPVCRPESAIDGSGRLGLSAQRHGLQTLVALAKQPKCLGTSGCAAPAADQGHNAAGRSARPRLAWKTCCRACSANTPRADGGVE